MKHTKTIILASLGLIATSITIILLSPSTKNGKKTNSKSITIFSGGKHLTVSKPLINQPYYDSVLKEQNKAKLKSIRSQYNSLINKYATINKLPIELIVSFIFIESTGNAKAVSADAYGLMQIGIGTANYIIQSGRVNDTLTSSELSLIKSKVKNANPLLKSSIGDNSGMYIQKNELFDPELNIMLGCKLIRYILDKNVSEWNEIRLDRLIAMYNRGINMNKNLLNGSVATVIDSLSKDSYGKVAVPYIKKMLSEDGTLDLLINEA